MTIPRVDQYSNVTKRFPINNLLPIYLSYLEHQVNHDIKLENNQLRQTQSMRSDKPSNNLYHLTQHSCFANIH